MVSAPPNQSGAHDEVVMIYPDSYLIHSTWQPEKRQPCREIG